MNFTPHQSRNMIRLAQILLSVMLLSGCAKEKKALVIQTDFGLKDGAVNEMKGVAFGIDPRLSIYDLTHEIPAFDIWQAGYRMYQAAPFWPKGTVFVSVVDPGVGTARRSIVMKSGNGQFFVTPDNGTLTLVADALGVDAVREIDEKINRRPRSESSYTFHGRDVFVYTAARLAAGKISFEEVGPLLNSQIMRLDYQQPILENSSIKGNIPVLDIQYGNVWTNINDSLFKKINVHPGDSLSVSILVKDSIIFDGKIPFANTFGDVREHKPLAYLNSLMNLSLAINMGSFADSFHVRSGRDWNLIIKR
jgi:S-adenosylmethionine hydrolase